MSNDDAIRASDGDREAVVTILRDAYAAGRLTLPELDERATAAFAGRTWGALRELTADLPDQPRLGPARPAVPAARPGEHAAAGTGPAGAAPGGHPWPGRGSASRLVPALPIAFFWIAISLFARGPAAYVPIVILLLIGLKFAGSHRPDEEGHRDPPGPPGPPGGPGQQR
ncbi:MAG: DUF1707 SHOCT-like domain-containing protein [Gemmatimonadota bacterium]